MSFPHNLRRARSQYQLSMRELADRVGVSHQAIKKYEDGAMYPSSLILVRLARALDLSIDDLMRSDDRAAIDATVERAEVIRSLRCAIAVIDSVSDATRRSALSDAEYEAVRAARASLALVG